MEIFSRTPGPHERGQMLADIDMIVDRSTTYKVLGDNGFTLLDNTGTAAPCGPAAAPIFQMFFRSRNGEPAFRAALSDLAQRWAAKPGVLRVRKSLFERPDMEAERKAGYPVKTHPEEQQYQGWIDLVLAEAAAAKTLFEADDGAEITTVHAYPAPAVYTFNLHGRPTLAGLRGYPAAAAIRALGATHQTDSALLHWMYGDIAEGVAPKGAMP
jgi:hypothetical protein